MEISVSSSPYSVSYWNYLNLYVLRPILAIAFVLSLILFGWFLAWKLVLVHVPLVQEIFGLRKKPIKSKPSTAGDTLDITTLLMPKIRFLTETSVPASEVSQILLYQAGGETNGAYLLCRPNKHNEDPLMPKRMKQNGNR
ncbi:hypothetical protein NMG60_11017468 [Bertholletia excelsa]